MLPPSKNQKPKAKSPSHRWQRNDEVSSLAVSFSSSPQSHAEPAKKPFVTALVRIRSRQQFLPHKNRVCSRHETERLGLVRQGQPPSTQPHHRRWHQDTRCCDHSHQLDRVNLRRIRKRSSINLNQQVDRNALRMGMLRGQLFEQTIAVLAVFAHSDDSPAADRDPGIAHMCQRFQPILIGPSRDDLCRRTRVKCRGCDCRQSGRLLPARRLADG